MAGERGAGACMTQPCVGAETRRVEKVGVNGWERARRGPGRARAEAGRGARGARVGAVTCSREWGKEVDKDLVWLELRG